MERFLSSIEQGLVNKDWYGALSTALTIPDICGQIDRPKWKVGKRYKRWYNIWLLPTYKTTIGGHEVIFMNAEDCYGLRCSYLHAGEGNLEKKAKQTLRKFHFIQPPPWGMAHRIKSNDILLLQVDCFCQEMVEAGRNWLQWLEAHEPEKLKRFDDMLVIHDASEGISF